jgi:hypothetical protein
MDGLIGIMRSTLCTPNFSDPPPALTYTLEPDLLAWGPFKMLFPPLVGVCSGVHFHFECTFMTLTPFPLAGFFKISLAVCYFSSGFGPWPSHYLPQWLLLGIFVQKVFETNLKFRYQRVRNLKKIWPRWSTFKVEITKVPIFCRMSYFLVVKIEICTKYFLDKNSQKLSLWLQGVYQRTNYRLTCTSFENVKGKQMWKHFFFWL